jgi:hypothetical protein
MPLATEADREPPTDRTATSADWAAQFGAEILEPYGWDRRNFIFSWHEEEISRAEFDRRYLASVFNPDSYRPPRFKQGL